MKDKLQNYICTVNNEMGKGKQQLTGQTNED